MKKEKEIEVENKDVYIKIDSSDSMELKKALLEIKASNVSMQMIAERLREKMNNELRERAVAKKHMHETSEAVAGFIETLPKMSPIIKKEPVEKAMHEKPLRHLREKALKTELEDIKRKISEL